MKNRLKTALLIINCLQGGGAERSVLTLGQGFYELGYDVHILRFKPLIEYDLNPNLTYHLVKFKPYKLVPGQVLKFKMFAKVVDAYVLKNIGQPDIVLSNLERPDRVMVHSTLDNVMHVIRNDVSNDFKIPANACITHPKIKDLIQVYGKHPCVCISKGVEADFKKLVGNQVTTTTIYNPFDITSIKQMANDNVDDILSASFTDAQINDERKNHINSILKSGHYIIHVGSFKYQKAHDVLLMAYAQSKQLYPLVLVGQGKLFNETKVLAASLGIEDKVIFLGFQKNPYPFIKHAKLMVLSSRFEGFGRVIAEALALGTPVISTDCPSGPSELLDKDNLVPVNDSAALASKIDASLQYMSRKQISLDATFLPVNVAQKYIDFKHSISAFKTDI